MSEDNCYECLRARSAMRGAEGLREDWLDRWSGRPVSEAIYEYACVRGDLTEQYARDQLAAIFERILADRLRKARAEALREAADQLSHIHQADSPGATSCIRWLRDRADGIETKEAE